MTNTHPPCQRCAWNSNGPGSKTNLTTFSITWKVFHFLLLGKRRWKCETRSAVEVKQSKTIPCFLQLHNGSHLLHLDFSPHTLEFCWQQNPSILVFPQKLSSSSSVWASAALRVSREGQNSPDAMGLLANTDEYSRCCGISRCLAFYVKNAELIILAFKKVWKFFKPFKNTK